MDARPVREKGYHEMITELAEKDAQTADNSSGASQDHGANAQIVSFRLANEEYGVDIMRVQEIILPGQITQMPQVPDYICGLINLRGSVIPIIDLRKRFGLTVAKNDENTRIIVVNVAGKTIGIVVDAVNEVLRFSSEQTEPPPSSIVGIDHDYIRGLVKFEDKLLILLNIDNVLSQAEQEAMSKSAEEAAA